MSPVGFLVGPARTQAERAVAPYHVWFTPDGTPWTRFFRDGPAYVVRFPGIADFDVSADGTAVRAWPVPDADGETVQHMFQNQVHPLALSLQGQLVLHGSAVDLGGHAVGFVGATGKGKSTLAASFARLGTPFLSDDALHLTCQGGQWRVQPGHPSLRLWADSEQALASHDAVTAPAPAFTSKSRFLAGPAFAFAERAQPLRALYFLGSADLAQPDIRPMRPAQVVLEMVKNSFLLDVCGQDALAWHFGELSRLAALDLHYELDFPRQYEALPRVQAAIVAHAAARNPQP